MASLNTSKVDGNTVSSSEYNQLAEVNNFITNTGQTPSTLNLQQIGIGASRYSSAGQYFEDTGIVNAYVLSPVSPFKSPVSSTAGEGYFSGLQITFKTANANTGASTVNINGAGVKNLKKSDGTTDLSSGEIPANQYISFIYNGTNFVKQAQTTATSTIQGISYLKPNINLIINGAMQIDQRNSGNSQTITAGSTLVYTVDRWYAYCTGANCTGQRVVGTSPNQYNYRFTGASSVSKIGFAQRIEASNSQHLANKSATLSVDLANSLLSSITWTMWYANTADTFGTLASPTRTQIATGSFTVNSNLNRYETTISIPAGATTGIEIEFSVGAQTSGTWTIGRVQLEDSLSSTPFEQRSLAIEEILCYRYYIQKSLNGGVGIGFDTTSISMTVNFPVVLRGTPTQSLLSGSLLVNDSVASTNRSSTGSTIVQSNNTKHGSRFRVNGFTGITAGRPYTLEDTFDVYSASAELN